MHLRVSLHGADDPGVEEGEQEDGHDPHHRRVGHQVDGGVHAVGAQAGVLHRGHQEARVGRLRPDGGAVCPGEHVPALGEYRRELPELDQVVQDREGDDAQDIAETIIDTSLRISMFCSNVRYLTKFLLKGVQMLQYLSRATATTLYTLPREVGLFRSDLL